MTEYWEGMKLIWAAPSDLHYSRDQVVFLLDHLEMLREGEYPPEPVSSGYIGGRGKRNRSQANFIVPTEIAAEIDIRLAKCGLDRYLVEDRYLEGLDERAISKKTGIDEEEVSKRINSVIVYLTYKKHLEYTYKEFKRRKLFRRKMPKRDKKPIDRILTRKGQALTAKPANLSRP